MRKSTYVNFDLHGKMTKKEQDTWRELRNDEWSEFHNQMQEKYFTPIYEQISALDENVLQVLQNMKECSSSVYQSLNEVGDAWVSDVENLGTCVRQLTDLLEQDL